jgi:hypothetical protein
MGAVGNYLDIVHKQFGFYATWLPGSLIEVGEIGVLRDGVFVHTAHLRDFGVKFRRKTLDAPSMRYASEGGVKFTASAKGSTDKVVSAIAKADAGLKIAFKKKGALVFVLDPATDDRIEDVDAITKWMDGAIYHDKTLPKDHIVVSHVRRAGGGVVAMAQDEGAEVQLKGGADLGSGTVTLAKVSGKFELVSANATEFVSIPRGRSGMTPVYRFLHDVENIKIFPIPHHSHRIRLARAGISNRIAHSPHLGR